MNPVAEKRLIRDLADFFSAVEDLRKPTDSELLDLVLVWDRQSEPDDRPYLYDAQTGEAVR